MIKKECLNEFEVLLLITIYNHNETKGFIASQRDLARILDISHGNVTAGAHGLRKFDFMTKEGKYKLTDLGKKKAEKLVKTLKKCPVCGK